MKSNIQQTYQDVLKSKVENIVNKQPYGLLKKVLKNIIENPKEKKYQTIKKSEKVSKLFTDEVIFILERCGFENKTDFFIYDESNYEKLHETFIEISSYAQVHQELQQNDVIAEWQELLKKSGEYPDRAILFFQQALQLVLVEYRKGYENYTLPCCHSYQSLGDYHANRQETVKAIECYELATTFVTEEYLKSHDELLNVAFDAYFSLGSKILLLPQPEQFYNKVEKSLNIAFSIALKMNDIIHLEKIANIFKLIYYQKKDFEKFAYWEKKTKEYQTPLYAKDTYVSRLMEIEQNMRGNPRKYIKEMIDLAEEAMDKSGEFSASLYGQIIYHHRIQKELNIEDGIQYGLKGLEIMRKIHGEKDSVVRNIYLSLADIYTRLGDGSKAQEYKQKQYNSEVLLGLREDEFDY